MAWPGWETFDPGMPVKLHGREDVLPLPARKPHKYHAEPTEVDGHLFPSKREAERYLELRQLERAGLISELRLQVSFPLRVGEIVIGAYCADFVYTDTDSGGPVVEECKGFPTPLWKWKRRHAEAQFGFAIRVS